VTAKAYRDSIGRGPITPTAIGADLDDELCLPNDDCEVGASEVCGNNTDDGSTPGVPPIPHVGGPILPTCSLNVLIGSLPAARVTDKALCVGPPDVIVKGSMTVLINSLPAARVLDQTAHGGMIVMGMFTVLVGG